MPEPTSYFGKDLEAMSFAKNYHRWILSEIRPYLGQRVAEVGAGSGNFSSLLLEAGIQDLQAYEPSQNMFAALQNNLRKEERATCINDYFGQQGESNLFDSLCYINVLEHIEDDATELQRAHQALKSQGHLLVFVPALQWLYSNFDKDVGHFRRYHKSALLNLVRTAGFQVVKARYFDLVGIVPWYLNFVLLKNGMGGGSVSLYDNIVVPVMRRFEQKMTPPLGKNILLIAKKDS